MSDIFYDLLAEVISQPFPHRADGSGPVAKTFDFASLMKQRILVDAS